MPTTITVYNDFQGTQRAYADDVDENFSNHRGTLLPIEENTAAASDNSHDLGSTDHRYRTAYLAQVPYVNGIQTNRFPISQVFDGSVPTELVDPIGELDRIAFPYDRDTDIQFDFVVPPHYTPGQRIGLSLRGYPETTGSAVFYSTARLFKLNSTNIAGSSTPAAVLTSTATLANAVAGLFVEDTSLKLSDGAGLINGITITVGDIISVQLKRATSAVGDTNTGKWFATGLMAELNN